MFFRNFRLSFIQSTFHGYPYCRCSLRIVWTIRTHDTPESKILAKEAICVCQCRGTNHGAHIIHATTTTSREHTTETTSIIRRSETETVANTNLTNRSMFEYSPYLLAGLAIAAAIIVGFTYARKRTTKTHSG